MRRARGIPLFLILLVCVALSPPPSPAQNNQQTLTRPMVIKSNSLVVDDSKRLITFSGNVTAERDDFIIYCDKMLVYYEKSQTNTSTNMMGSRITRIVADGNVKINRKAGGEALSRHAEYYEGQNRIVLTGEPMVKQGKDFVQGDKITIFLKENRSIVEGSQEKRVKAVIYPKREAK